MNKQIATIHTSILNRANLSWTAAIVALVAIVVGVAWPTSLAAQDQPSLDLSSLSVTDQNGTTVSIGTFDPATTTYSGSVDSTVERIKIDAIASAGSSADVQTIPRDSQPGTPGHQVELSHGTNLILVSVDSSSIDAVLKTYAVQIIRGGAAASGTANVVSINGGDYRAREGSTVPFLLTRTGDTTQELTVQIEISEWYDDKVPASSEGRFDVEFEAGHASARHDVETMGDSLARGISTVEGRVRSGSGYTVGTNSGTLAWQVWDDDYGTLNLKSIVVNDMASNNVDIGTFDPAETSYFATVASTEEYVTVSAAKPLEGWRGTFIVPGDSEPDVSGHQVALSHGTNLIAVGVYSSAPDEKELVNIYELKIERSGTATAGAPINVGVNGPHSVNEGAMLPFLLTRTGDTSQSLTVQFDVTETGGDMVSGLYEGQKEVEFLAGEAFAKHYIGTMADEVWEEHSTVKVEVTGGTGYQVSQSAGSASTLVEDNDLPDMTAALTLDTTEVDEGDQITATVTVTTEGPQIPHEHAGTLVIRTSSGTAGEDDFELNDFGLINHLALHAQGAFKPVEVDGKTTAFQAKLSVTIDILDDHRAEPDEIFYVGMEDYYGLRTDAVTMDTDNTKHTVTIRGEDETPPVPSEAGYATVVVTDSGTTGSAFSISWYDPAGCDSEYSVRLEGAFNEFYSAAGGLGPNGWDYSDMIPVQVIGSTSREITEIVGALEYIDSDHYSEELNWHFSYVPRVIVRCVGSHHLVSEVPLLSQAGGSVERPKPGTYSSEAPLTGLTISSGTLSPAFNKDGFLYSVLDVPNEDEQVTFTATAKSDYSISWDPVADADPDTDGHQVDIEVGYNTIYVTADHDEGLLSFVYEVIVKRAEASLVSAQQQTDVTLSALNLSGINLSFDPTTTEYTVEVENGVTETSVTPTPNDSGSTFVIKLDGVKNSDGTVSLSAGSNVITVEVTAADGFTSLTYTVTITRPTSISVPDSLPTGWPTISGTAQVGETLTVDTSGIADADGLTNVSYSYQWIRNYGTSDTSIAGATDATYTLVAADVGKTIKVRVTFTDDASNEESLTSEATVAVDFAVQQQGASNSPASGQPIITGTAQVGQTLTVDTSAIDDADGLVNVNFSYQWERQNLATGTWTTWTGSATTYVLTSDDRDSAVRVSVSFSDDAGNDETLSSYWLLVLTPPNNPATGVPTISGAAQVGETLTAETSGIADADGLDDATFAYQWLADDANIAGATAATYTVNAADEGQTIRVSVTFTDDAGHEQTLTSAATELVQPRPAPGSPPDAPNQPEGTAVFVGGVNLEWNDVPDADSYGVQMYRNGQWTDLPGDGIEIAFYGAGSIISELEPEGSSYWFRVRAGNAHGFSEWSDFNFMAPTTQSKSGRQARPDNTPASGEPVISGTAQVGETLTADTADVEDGNGLDRVQFRFQWVSHDGSADTDIANATDSTYTVVADEAGKTIKVRVAFTDRGGYAESLTSAATATVAAAPNSPATGAPAATGTAEVGETLTADTSGIADTNGLTNVSYNYQWVANDGNVDTDITDAMDSTYTLVSANEGKTIKVRVSFTDDDGNIESLTSEATEAVSFAVQPQLASNPATGTPTITGTAQAGETLTVDTSDISDNDGLVNVTFGYQWISNDGTTDTDITDETNPTYVIKPWDLGNYIKVRVSFSDNAGNKETLTSAPTSGVEKSPNHPAKGWLNLLGMAEVGQELRVVDVGLGPGWSLQDANGLTYATFSYLWIRSDGTIDVEIPNATGSSYTLVDADEGESIKVRVSFTDDGANAETLTSSATNAVTARPDTTDLSAPTALSANWSRGEEKGNDLEWMAPEGTVTGYQILRTEIPTTLWREPYAYGCTPLMEVHVSDTGGDATTYTDTDVAEGASYIYSVRALNSDGVGRKSASPRSLQYRPPHVYSPSGVPTGSYWPSGAPGTPYRVPTNLASSQIKNGIGLTWDAPDGEVTGYQILRRSPEQCDFGYLVYVENTNSTDTHWADRDVVAGTLYEYHIRAVNDVGVGRLDRDISTSLRPTTLVVGPGPNNPATGTPTVSGTAQVGETLTADSSGIVDADGMYWAAFEYQWLADDTEIDGATSTTYALQVSDANKVIKVRINFMDDAGYEESLTSAATAAVSPNVSATGAPTITGTVEVGETLTVDTSGIEDEDGLDNVSFSYQWIHSDGTDDWDIVGATGTTYAITAADADKAIKLRVNFTDDKGSVESLTSSATVTVPIEVAFTFSIEGTTVNCDSWNVHIVNVPYKECDDPISTDQGANGEIDVEIEIARSVSSQLYKFDFGIYQMEDSLGNYGPNKANDLCLGPGLAESALLEVTPDDGTGPFTYTDDGTIFGLCAPGTYQLGVYWYRYNGEDEEYEDAGSFTRYFFITSNEDVDTSIEKVKWITALYPEPPFTHGDVEIEATKQSTVLNRELTTYSLTIDGLVPDSDTATTDYVVRVRIIGDGGPGKTVPWCHVGNVGYSYRLKSVPEDGRWEMDAHVLGGCISHWWPDTLQVELFDGVDLTNYSEPILLDGSYIISHNGGLLYPEYGTHEFIAGKDISLGTLPNSAAAGAPTISGMAQVGETLAADTSGITDADGLDNVSFNYQWLSSRDTEISGATGSTYTLVADDEGKVIKVKVTFTDDEGNEESLTSEATEAVKPPQPPARPTGLSTAISHDAVTLAWDDPQDDSITGYVILRRDREIHPVGTFVTLTGDTGSADTTYTDGTVEVDKEYVYRIKAINEHGEMSEMSHWLRADTPEVPVPDKPTGLSATVVSHDAVTLAWDDPQDDSITGYVILRRDRAIHPVGTFVTLAGDTGSADTTYTDDTVEADKEYVYRIKAINEHRRVSEMSHWVRGFTPAAPPIDSSATGQPTITGTAQVGETLTADTSDIADEDGLANATYSYQWVANGGTTDTDISGATDAAYTLVADDVGQTIKVRVSFTDDDGNPESLTSAATDEVDFAVQQQGASNSPAAGEPTITGTAQVGQTLSVDTSGIADDDGLANAVFSYQWLSDDAEIGGATGSTYTLVDDDEGKTIKVRVAFTDDDGNPETLTSAATEAVEAAPQPNSPATGQPTITGTAQVGETLTADTSDIADEDGLDSAVFAYQWLSDDAEIGGATGSSYTLVDDDEGRTIKVRVTVTDDLWNETTLTSAATEAVEAAPPTDSPATGQPTIIGTAQVGETLSVDTSGIADDDGLDNAVFAYQWLSDDAEISGATDSTYTLVDDDEGKTIRVRVTVTDDLGNETTLTSAATEAVAAAAPQPDSPAIGEPTITGTAQVGQTLTADTSGIADDDGLDNAVFAYQWVSGDDTDIAGATSSTYTLVDDDEGRTIKVMVTFTDDDGNPETLTSAATEAVEAAPQPDSPTTGEPTITGTAQVGQTLTADTSGIADEDGLDNAVFAYQWLSDDAEIGGATGSTYALVDDDEGQTIKVRVTVTDDLGNETTLTSAATDAVEAKRNTAATGRPTISGTVRVGETLTADTSGIEDADGLTNVSYRYQWVVTDGGAYINISGETGATYTLVSADRGLRILVRVSFTDDAGKWERLTSAATDVVAAAP